MEVSSDILGGPQRKKPESNKGIGEQRNLNSNDKGGIVQCNEIGS